MTDLDTPRADPQEGDAWGSNAIGGCSVFRCALLFVLLVALEPLTAREAETHDRPAARPSLVLLTLDTTRADALGPRASGRSLASERSVTPVLDSLSAAGVRYTRALTPSPLTLAAHASIMTGLDPPEHGVRDNGTTALSSEIPTLASTLSEEGFSTAGFVASRVLDRRFGLARGFDLYDDQMTAERLGEYGYPERDAAAVTSAAISWITSAPSDRPFFLWVHYYDPHAPYDPPGVPPSAAPEQRYLGEVAFVDREIGRLLDALPAHSRGQVIAVVGDHGESLGEHGERGHGIFLYGASLNVPLMVVGPGVAEGRAVEDVVSIRRLPATLLRLLDPEPGARARSRLKGPPLPGIAGADAQSTPIAVYSETRHPSTAYGWASLRAVSNNRWRLIDAPRRELYDLIANPGETRDLAEANPDQVRLLLEELRRFDKRMEPREAPDVERDADLFNALRGLGYLSSGGGAGRIDPKDGIRLLEDFERAKAMAASGNQRAALAIFQSLVHSNPRNVPFLSHLAGAQLATGDGEAAVANYRRAVALNPRLEFLHLNLAEAYRTLGRTEEARREYETVVRFDPRSGAAWIKLAEAAHNAGHADEERSLLLQAVESGTNSGVVHFRLGQIASAEADFPRAIRHFRRASELVPGWLSPWLARGTAEERSRRFDEARSSYRQAVEIDPRNPGALLGLARSHRFSGRLVEERRVLERLLAIAPASPQAREARERLANLDGPD